MKKLLFFILAPVILASCGGNHANDEGRSDGEGLTYYGAEMTPDGAISTAELVGSLEGQSSVDAKVKATIKETCVKMGCWMSVDLESGDDMMVFMKDHDFFVPTEGAAGLSCIFEGTAYYDTLSVDWLQHLAEDAGRSQEEIDAITEPEFKLAFDAAGVIIEGYTAVEEEDGHDHEHGHDEDGEHHHDEDDGHEHEGEGEHEHDHDHEEGDAQ
jgi:hypothetical protein